jgi:hypothetical protein
VFSLSEVFPHLSRLAGLTLEESQLIYQHPKSFGSLLYPLASVQEEYRGTARSAQNIFSGFLFFFALIHGFRYLKQYWSKPMAVLLVFGLIYGLASLGPHTPVQPFFFHYVPGCNQFFYAVFYRYFAWFMLLVIACIGVHHAMENGKFKHLLWFLGGGVLLYALSVLWSWDSFEAVKLALSDHWEITFRRMTWTSALLLDSLVHLVVLILLILLLMWKRSLRLLPLCIVIELACIAQLNLPVTTYGEIRSATLDNYLATKRQGFPLPDNRWTIAENDRVGYYASLWRNLGNYTNLSCSSGYTSFRLRGREKVWKEQGELANTLPNHALAYLAKDSVLPRIIAFEPGKMKLKIPEQKGEELIVQQANYPGWKATIDGQEAKIHTVNSFQMGLTLAPGEHTVELEFSNPKISFLFYLTQYGFLVLLFLYWGLEWKAGTTIQRAMALSLLLGVILLRQLSFGKSPAQTLSAENGKEKVQFTGQMTIGEYTRLWKWITAQKEMKLRDLRDDDPVVMGLARHHFATLRQEGEMLIGEGLAEMDTNRHVIPAAGFYDVTVPESYREGWLIYSMDVHERATELNDVMVVVELKEEERIIYAQAMPLRKILRNGANALTANGYLIPELNGKRYLKMYLWNNSSASFTFSNFKLGLMP